jgi:hypothetical protein
MHSSNYGHSHKSPTDYNGKTEKSIFSKNNGQMSHLDDFLNTKKTKNFFPGKPNNQIPKIQTFDKFRENKNTTKNQYMINSLDNKNPTHLQYRLPKQIGNQLFNSQKLFNKIRQDSQTNFGQPSFEQEQGNCLNSIYLQKSVISRNSKKYSKLNNTPTISQYMGDTRKLTNSFFNPNKSVAYKDNGMNKNTGFSLFNSKENQQLVNKNSFCFNKPQSNFSFLGKRSSLKANFSDKNSQRSSEASKKVNSNLLILGNLKVWSSIC